MVQVKSVTVSKDKKEANVTFSNDVGDENTMTLSSDNWMSSVGKLVDAWNALHTHEKAVKG